MKHIRVDGVYPDRNKSYQYTTEVYAVIREDAGSSSMAYKLYDWLLTESGQQVVNESGYVSIKNWRKTLKLALSARYFIFADLEDNYINTRHIYTDAFDNALRRCTGMQFIFKNTNSCHTKSR